MIVIFYTHILTFNFSCAPFPRPLAGLLTALPNASSSHSHIASRMYDKMSIAMAFLYGLLHTKYTCVRVCKFINKSVTHTLRARLDGHALNFIVKTSEESSIKFEGGWTCSWFHTKKKQCWASDCRIKKVPMRYCLWTCPQCRSLYMYVCDTI